MRDFSDMDSDARISEAAGERASQIRRGSTGRVVTFQRVQCNLDIAQESGNALRISVPFKSVFVRVATDSTAVVYLSPNENSIGSIAEAMPLYKNDSFDFGEFISAGYLWWPRQAGKSIELYLATQGRMQPGSQVSQVAGGLSVSDGSALNSNKLSGGAASVSVGTTATQILPANTDRKVATLYLSSGLWVGDSAVATGTRGIYAPQGQFVYRNTAPLYGIAPAGTVTVTGNVEE